MQQLWGAPNVLQVHQVPRVSNNLNFNHYVQGLLLTFRGLFIFSKKQYLANFFESVETLIYPRQGYLSHLFLQALGKTTVKTYKITARERSIYLGFPR